MSIESAVATPRQRADRLMLTFLIVHCVASAVHFAHNGIFIRDYPNLPASLTSTGVYLTWLAVNIMGAVGYFVYRGWRPRIGLALMAAYAMLGFGGLDHYVVAPVGAHSFVMNATILFEVITAAALLGNVVRASLRLKTQAIADLS